MTETSTIDQNQAQTALGQKALGLLRSIVADVQTMHMPLRLEEFASTEMDTSAFFGEFIDYYDGSTELMISDEVGVRVYWPNLKVLMDEAAKLLKEEDAA